MSLLTGGLCSVTPCPARRAQQTRLVHKLINGAWAACHSGKARGARCLFTPRGHLQSVLVHRDQPLAERRTEDE